MNSNKNLPKCLVFYGPSGVGKSTLIKMLMKKYPNAFSFTISHTTREPRSGESDGIEYYFNDRDVFLEKVIMGEFIEWTEFSSNLYGTSKNAIYDATKLGQTCILDLDLNGVKSMKELDEFNINFILVKPTSFDELRKRLEYRNTDINVLEERIKQATIDFHTIDEKEFDLILINDNLETTFDKLESFILDYLKIKN